MRFSLWSVQDVNLLRGFLWTRRQLRNVSHCGHPANLSSKHDRSFPECPQYFYSIGHYSRESRVVSLNFLLCHLIQHFWKDLRAQADKRGSIGPDHPPVWSCILPLTQMGDIIQVEEQVSPDTLCGPFLVYTPSIQNGCTGGVEGYLVLWYSFMDLLSVHVLEIVQLLFSWNLTTCLKTLENSE